MKRTEAAERRSSVAFEARRRDASTEVFACLACAVLLVAAACSGRQARIEPIPPAPSAETAEVAGKSPGDAERPPLVHVVRPGETLWRIARRYGVPLELLAKQNGIDDPAVIREGMRLTIPGRGRDPAGAVRPGETERSGAPDGWTWPLRGAISSRLGARRSHGPHQGIDILAPQGSPVVAARDGTVSFSGRRGNYGQVVYLEHRDGYTSIYAHNSENLVRRGVHVKRGQVIARSGQTGNATAPHLHFEVRRHGRVLDPLLVLPPL